MTLPDREKVIRGLTVCTDHKPGDDCQKCPYQGEEYCTDAVMRDALDLLRENEKPDCEHAEHDGIGCLGYAGCTQDDEPIDVCKTCREYTGNRYEEMSGDE